MSGVERVAPQVDRFASSAAGGVVRVDTYNLRLLDGIRFPLDMGPVRRRRRRRQKPLERAG